MQALIGALAVVLLLLAHLVVSTLSPHQALIAHLFLQSSLLQEIGIGTGIVYHHPQWAITPHHHTLELCSSLLIQDILRMVVHPLLMLMLLTILLMLNHTHILITHLRRVAHGHQTRNHLSSNFSMDGSKFVQVVKDLI